MKGFCFVSVVVTLLVWPASGWAQTGCKPSDPSGYFEGTARSQQEGKLDVSLNLLCDKGRYVGQLTTPVGTYSVKDGYVEVGKLHLNLENGPDGLALEVTLDAGVLRGKFTAGADSGPIEMGHLGEAKSSVASEGVGLTKSQWHEDLMFLARELQKRHANAFHYISRERFETEVAELDRKLDHLNSDEIYVGRDHIVNLIGDAHTYLKVPEDDANFPIDIQRFGDEYRLTATASGNQNALGARVIKIQDTSIAWAHELLSRLTPPDETEVLRNLRITGFLTTGIFLHGMGVIPDRNVARYTLADDNGKEFTIDVHAVKPGDSSKLNWTYVFKERPLFRQKPGDDFWYTYLPDSRTVYCSFRAYKDLGKHSKGFST